MDLTSKMLPLIAVLVSICFSNTEAYMRLLRPRIPLIHRSGSEDKGCICFPPADDKELVPDRLKSQGHKNLKRLVTYFYIDIDTNEAASYIPDPEKQKMYPDLALGELDVLTEFTVYNFNLCKNVQRHVEIKGEESHSKDIDEEDNNDSDLGSDLGSDEDGNGKENTSLVTTEVILPLSTQTDLPTSTNEAVSDSSDSFISLGLVSSSEVQHVAKKSLPIAGYSVNLPSTDTTPVTIADGSYHSKNLLSDDLNHIIDNYPTFENWYEKQMTKFSSTQPGNLLHINNNKFKETLKGTLAINRIILSDDGILRWLDGTVIDVNKLELRAIWIGEKLSFKDLIGGNYPNINKDSANTLQTVLVSLVYPPRILGIIPLGRSSLGVGLTKLTSSTSASRTPHTLISRPETLLSSGSSSLVASHSIQRSETSNSLKKASLSEESAPITLKQIAETESASRKPLKLISSHVKKPDTPLSSETSSLVALKTIKSSETSDSLKKESSSGESKQVKNEYPLNEQVLRTVIEILKKDQNEVDDDDDEPPGIRIIGGKAAVSSGSLINNKGRSGLIRHW